MIGGMLQRVFGSPNDRFVKSLRGTVDAINAAESALEALDDLPKDAATSVKFGNSGRYEMTSLKELGQKGRASDSCI